MFPRYFLRRGWNGCAHLLHFVRFAGWVVHREEDRRPLLRYQTDVEQDASGGGYHLCFHFRRDGVVVGALERDVARSHRGPGEIGCSADLVRAGGELYRVVGVDDRDLAVLAVADDAIWVALDFAMVVVEAWRGKWRTSLGQTR